LQFAKRLFVLYAVRIPQFAQTLREDRSVVIPPMIAAAIPTRNNHIDLFVGVPLKNREKSELKESMALIPQIIRAMPTPSKANPIPLFIPVLFS
jgi:hypothetical protein